MKNITNTIMAAGILTLVSCGSGGSTGSTPNIVETDDGFVTSKFEIVPADLLDRCIDNGDAEGTCDINVTFEIEDVISQIQTEHFFTSNEFATFDDNGYPYSTGKIKVSIYTRNILNDERLIPNIISHGEEEAILNKISHEVTDLDDEDIAPILQTNLIFSSDISENLQFTNVYESPEGVKTLDLKIDGSLGQFISEALNADEGTVLKKRFLLPSAQ